MHAHMHACIDQQRGHVKMSACIPLNVERQGQTGVDRFSESHQQKQPTHTSQRNFPFAPALGLPSAWKLGSSFNL